MKVLHWNGKGERKEINSIKFKTKGVLESYLLIYDLKIKENFPLLYWKRRHIFQCNTEERSMLRSLNTVLKSKQVEASGENSSEGEINMNVGVSYKLIG